MFIYIENVLVWQERKREGVVVLEIRLGRWILDSKIGPYWTNGLGGMKMNRSFVEINYRRKIWR